MITVDAPVNGLRNRIQRSGFTVPEYAKAINVCQYHNTPVQLTKQDDSIIFQGFMSKSPSWKDIEWVRNNTELPIVIKGIINPADAQIACNLKLDGIVISNHGGRTLDTLPNPIQVLADIRAQVTPEFPIIVDSGIRRGGDVFKALALGANAVMVGRPIMYALATAGALGVAHTIRLLRDELELTMALCGCATLADISVANLWRN